MAFAPVGGPYKCIPGAPDTLSLTHLVVSARVQMVQRSCRALLSSRTFVLKTHSYLLRYRLDRRGYCLGSASVASVAFVAFVAYVAAIFCLYSSVCVSSDKSDESDKTFSQMAAILDKSHLDVRFLRCLAVAIDLETGS